MSERMWISEQLEQARTERDQARLELAALRAERAKLEGAMREATAELLYLRQHSAIAIWANTTTKQYWREKAARAQPAESRATHGRAEFDPIIDTDPVMLARLRKDAREQEKLNTYTWIAPGHVLALLDTIGELDAALANTTAKAIRSALTQPAESGATETQAEWQAEWDQTHDEYGEAFIPRTGAKP
jgi:hypothetical protein